MESNHEMLRREYNLPELERYELISYIDKGRWSEVFLARRSLDGGICAVKFPKPDEYAMRQLQERGWTIEEYVRRATLHGNVTAFDNVAWNFPEEAKDHSPFIIEEYIPYFMPEFVKEVLDKMPTDTRRQRVDKTKIIYEVARGIAKGLFNLHNEVKVAHSDLHLGNIGFNLYNRRVKIADFGTATIGIQKNPEVGYLLSRSPIRFNAIEGTSTDDVWSFGANIYKLFTGRFPFEDELKFCDNPSAYMGELYGDTSRYKRMITSKLNDDKIPKPFRRLLHDCFAYERDRIQDGKELVKELEHTITSYDKSMPLQRFKRYSICTAAAGLIVVAGLGSYGTLQAQGIKQELVKEQGNRQYEKQLRLIKLHQDRTDKDGMHNDTYFDYIDSGRLDAVLSRFKDKRTGYAFFLNPESTTQAIKMAGGKTDYESVKKQIWNIDTDLGCSLIDIEGCTDGIACRMAGDNYSEMSQKINGLEKKYGVRLNDFQDDR